MIALVTGGCSGFGFFLTRELLSRGYDVIALYYTSEENAKAMALQYENLKCISCDITNEERVKEVFSSIKEIDILIHNAATARDNPFMEKSLEEFMQVVRVNLGGTFNILKYASSKVKNVIVNISSDNTLGNHNPISMDYDASKAGVNMLTKDFKEVLACKIIAVAPGWIATPAVENMNPIFLKNELAKNNQKALLDPKKLAKKIVSIALSTIESGSIIKIKEEDI